MCQSTITAYFEAMWSSRSRTHGVPQCFTLACGLSRLLQKHRLAGSPARMKRRFADAVIQASAFPPLHLTRCLGCRTPFGCCYVEHNRRRRARSVVWVLNRLFFNSLNCFLAHQLPLRSDNFGSAMRTVTGRNLSCWLSAHFLKWPSKRGTTVQFARLTVSAWIELSGLNQLAQDCESIFG